MEWSLRKLNKNFESFLEIWSFLIYTKGISPKKIYNLIGQRDFNPQM